MLSLTRLNEGIGQRLLKLTSEVASKKDSEITSVLGGVPKSKCRASFMSALRANVLLVVLE
jgi:hypothetical protein